MYPPVPQPPAPWTGADELVAAGLVPAGLVAAGLVPETAVESELSRVAWAGRYVTTPTPVAAISVSAPPSTHKRLLRMEPPPVDRPGWPFPEDSFRTLRGAPRPRRVRRREVTTP
jgi:hypothetical protein